MSGALPSAPLPGVIVAAGGLVWRRVGAVRQVLLIRRARYYENEWALPKGKAERNETWLETAIREVAEEAECTVEVGPFAGCNSYAVGSTPKIVLFWNMRFVAELPTQPQEEVVERDWVTAEEAMTRLTHVSERAILQVNAAISGDSW